MNLFNTPEEAIDACDKECNMVLNNVYPPSYLDLKLPPQYQPMLKQAFKTGFMAGVQFLSNNILQAVPKKDINQIKK
jgi:hypothetical protein